MRILPLLALTALLSPCHAMVVTNGSDDASWWNDGAKNPMSFGVLDADGDGQVSKDELAKAQTQFQTPLKETRASLLDAADADHSGKLSRFEAQETRPRFASLRARAVEIARAIHDQDHDGKLSEAERKNLVKAIGQVFVKNDAVATDANRDGNLTTAEVTRAVESILEGKGALFTICDRNNDGQVSQREAKLAFDILAVAAGLQPLP